jgi:hypothetical protein
VSRRRCRSGSSLPASSMHRRGWSPERPPSEVREAPYRPSAALLPSAPHAFPGPACLRPAGRDCDPTLCRGEFHFLGACPGRYTRRSGFRSPSRSHPGGHGWFGLPRSGHPKRRVRSALPDDRNQERQTRRKQGHRPEFRCLDGVLVLAHTGLTANEAARHGRTASFCLVTRSRVVRVSTSRSGFPHREPRKDLPRQPSSRCSGPEPRRSCRSR